MSDSHLARHSAEYGVPDRWFILSLLAVNYFTLYLHRNLIQYVQPPLTAELGLTDTQLGWLDTAFRIAYAIAQIGVGYFGDRYRRRTVLLFSQATSTAILGAMGLTQNFSQLLVLRIMLAVTQSASVPAIASIMADAFTPKARSRAVSIYLLSSPISIAVAGWLGGLLADMTSWRAMFGVFAAFGACVVVGLYALLRELERTERAQGRGLGTGGGSLLATLGSVVTVPSFLLLAIAYVLAVSASQLTLFWLPRYFYDVFGMDSLEEAGRLATVPTQAGTIVGCLVGGVWADQWARTRISGRFNVQLVGLLICIPAIVVMSTSQDRWILTGVMFVYGTALWLYLSNLWTSTFEVVDPAARATAIGLLNVVSGVFGAWLSPLVGNLYETGKITSLGTAFLGTAVLAAAAALMVIFILVFTFCTFGQEFHVRRLDS
jgi:sugar phosphate permease